MIGSAKSINQHIARPGGFQFGQHRLIAGYSFRKPSDPGYSTPGKLEKYAWPV
jgi:hypothetical protein